MTCRGLAGILCRLRMHIKQENIPNIPYSRLELIISWNSPSHGVIVEWAILLKCNFLFSSLVEAGSGVRPACAQRPAMPSFQLVA